MKVSVITVCWNSEAVLGRALASLREQTYADIQMVIVDGGSTDGTLSLARAVAREGDIIISERDKGIYNAMNKGIGLATGELVYFLNSDDRLAGPTVIADIVKVAESSSADVIVGDVMMCGGEGGDYLKTHAHIRRWNLLQERICHQASFVRRALFDKCGRFDEGYPVCADHEFFVRAMFSGATLLHVPGIVAEFQLGGHSTVAAAKNNSETKTIQRRYQRPMDIPLLFAYRAVRKAYRAVNGHWLERPQ